MIEVWKEKYGGAQTVVKKEKTMSKVDLEAEIKKQGDLVRELKGKKADAAEIKKQVAVLLALKKELSEY